MTYERAADQPREEGPEKSAIATVGVPVSEVAVSIGPSFLQLFSEQLYSSPNKAFEELVSNSWDAGATAVYIGMAADLDKPAAAVWVLDNGESMDGDGIELLWKVAYSTKPTRAAKRPQIGKFGIGKLSTYLLAHELTYVCRAADGVTRAVTLDYRDIGKAGEGLHIEKLPLAVRKIDEAELDNLLAEVESRGEIMSLIRRGVPQAQTDDADEFGPGDGGGDEKPSPAGTWTLVVLTALKDAGRNMETGRIRRMLRTALPLGDTISIVYAGEPLTSVKLDVGLQTSWEIGPGLGVESVEIPAEGGGDPKVYRVQEHALPYPHVTIDGLAGRVTGTVRLFEESISGGKSSAVAASNGFFVNIVGRVVNSGDPYFGLTNLNHSAWAKMRTAIRADGLNEAISVDRESVLDDLPVAVFRALLRAIFNKVRAAHDAADNASWPNAGAILTEKWGTVPLKPLRRVLDERMTEGSDPPPFVELNEEEAAAVIEKWQEGPTEEVVSDVTFVETGGESPLVRYDVAERTVIVNRDHPFAREHGDTHEEQLLLRDAALVDLLTQAYMMELGVHDETISQIETYRDQLLRLVARLRRRSGAALAEMLDAVTSDAKALERAVTEALEYLGFVVEYISGSGEPEGLAEAPLTHGRGRKARRRYTFTYDAKSSKSGRVSNGDVRVSGLLRHKDKYEAEHVLVVAPDYERGALDEECEKHKVTPMRSSDLSRLLLLQATVGPIDLERFRGVFEMFDPDAVHDFVEELATVLEQQERLSFDDFFDALSSIGYQEPDALTTDVVAREIRRAKKTQDFPKVADVTAVVNGLSVLVPHLIRLNGRQVFLGAEPATLRDAVVTLLARVPERYRIARPE